MLDNIDDGEVEAECLVSNSLSSFVQLPLFLRDGGKEKKTMKDQKENEFRNFRV